MKKIILTTIVLGAVSSNVYATKARLTGLGEDVEDGTFYIDDDRSIFRNAAYVNDYSNSLILELGQNGNSAQADSALTPKQHGTLIKNAGSINYAVSLGNDGNTPNLLRLTGDTQTVPTASTLNKQENMATVLFGGGSDLKWGAGLTYAKYENKTSAGSAEDKTLAAHLGAKQGAWEAYANISLQGEAKNAAGTEKFDGDAGYHFGGSYVIGKWRPFASYKMSSWKTTEGGATYDGDFSRMDVGTGYTHDTGSGTIYSSVRYNKIDVELKDPAGTATFERGILPITVGFEMPAASWLTVRSGINHVALGSFEQKNLANVNSWARTLLAAGYGAAGNTTDGKFSYATSTSVDVGSTLTLDRVKIDGVLGYDLSGTSVSRNGKLNMNDFMARVGMTYNF